MWIATKRFKIKRGDAYVMINIGEPVPDVEFWKDKEKYIRTNFVKEVLDVKKEKEAPVEVKEEKPVEVKEEPKKSTFSFESESD